MTPSRPLPLCNEPGCHERVKNRKERKCVDHLRVKYRRHQKKKTADVKSDYHFYNSMKWRKFSARYKALNMWCRICREAGHYRPAAFTDHIVPIRLGGKKYCKNNLQPLCTICHNVKRQKERNM